LKSGKFGIRTRLILSPETSTLMKLPGLLCAIHRDGRAFWRSKTDTQSGQVTVTLSESGRRATIRVEPDQTSAALTLRTADGAQMSFTKLLHGWCVTAVEDRNGNYISVVSDWRGDIQNVTDTLGRTIYFKYDSNANLISITQSWSGQSQPHTWVTFGWDNKTVSSSFSSRVVGTFNGESIPVVSQIALDDGSRYNFEYSGAMQVNKIHRYTFDPSINDYGERTYMAWS